MLENVLDIPIYIGSSFAPFDINIANNYFYNKANVKFSERQVSKVEIIFEQESLIANTKKFPSRSRSNFDLKQYVLDNKLNIIGCFKFRVKG